MCARRAQVLPCSAACGAGSRGASLMFEDGEKRVQENAPPVWCAVPRRKLCAAVRTKGRENRVQAPAFPRATGRWNFGRVSNAPAQAFSAQPRPLAISQARYRTAAMSGVLSGVISLARSARRRSVGSRGMVTPTPGRDLICGTLLLLATEHRHGAGAPRQSSRKGPRSDGAAAVNGGAKTGHVAEQMLAT